MKVYVSSFESYNNGDLSGEWVDLADFSCKEDFLDYCSEICDGEIMFQDWENIENELISSSYISEHAFSWAELYNSLNDDEYNDLIDFSYHVHSTVDIDAIEVKRDYDDCYLADMPLSDFAEVFLHETYSVPSGLEYYIDYSLVAHDLEMNGYFEINGKTFMPL